MTRTERRKTVTFVLTYRHSNDVCLRYVTRLAVLPDERASTMKITLLLQQQYTIVATLFRRFQRKLVIANRWQNNSRQVPLSVICH